MAQEPHLANEDPTVIRQHIEETRSSLTEKLESLEHEVKETVVGVKETVAGAKEAVTNTVEAVKETVSETVDTVKRTFDLRHQTEQHPWAMTGGAFAAGFIAGIVAPNPTGRWARQARDEVCGIGAAALPDGGRTSYRPVESAVNGPPNRPEEPGLLSELGQRFSGEIDKLKGLAIGTTMGVLRDLLTQQMPGQLATQLRGIFDGVTAKLGGQPIEGPVLESFRPTPEHRTF